MSFTRDIRNYYGLFGPRGALLAAWSGLFHIEYKASVAVPGVRSPVHVRLLSSDVLVLRQVFLRREYAWELGADPSVILDAGANIGLTSVFFANQYPKARIIALEPESSNYEMLRKNVEPYRNVIPVRAALSRENGSVALVDPGEDHWGFRTCDNSPLNTEPSSVAVRAVTVDRLMADLSVERIDLLKVDIEGAEKEVFEGSAVWIQSVGAILIELHDRYKAGCSRSVYQATREFEREERRGEIILFSRGGMREGVSSQGGDAGTHPDDATTPPLRIVNARQQRRGSGESSVSSPLAGSVECAHPVRRPVRDWSSVLAGIVSSFARKS